MKLKLIKNPNSNSIEATFYKEVESTSSIIVKKEIEGEFIDVKEDTNVITTNVIHCQSYSDLQIDLLREHAEKFKIIFTDEQEAIVSDVIKNIVPLTKLQLEEIEIEKENTRILSIKNKAGQVIESKYSIFKQLNITNLLEGYAEEDKEKMIDFINSIRAISNKAEIEGTALEDINWNI